MSSDNQNQLDNYRLHTRHDSAHPNDMISISPPLAHSSNPIPHTQFAFQPSNLQAGRKRRESELDTSELVDGAGVRRRITRACDQCNQLRTKCDGSKPCQHCRKNALVCEYARVHKKRGRAPRRDQDSNEDTKSKGSTATGNVTSIPTGAVMAQPNTPGSERAGSISNLYVQNGETDTPLMASNQAGFFNQYSTDETMPMHTPAGFAAMASAMGRGGSMEFAASASHRYSTNDLEPMQSFGFPLGDDYSVAFMGKPPLMESPNWLALTTPGYLPEQMATPPRPVDTLRFPVLQPLLTHIEHIIPHALACDLLEQYFIISTSAHRPKNPYILGSIFRKSAILHQTDPRPCSPSLLASMLWISAQHSDAAFLTSQPDARARTCRELLDLTISLLKPFIHTHGAVLSGQPNYTAAAQMETGLGNLVLPVDLSGNQNMGRLQVDHIATYIHLATVVSASERKAASLRWWNAAWSLAREMRLGRELPRSETVDETQVQSGSLPSEQPNHRKTVSSGESTRDVRSRSNPISEENREERRRVWWLLYMVDRHLALCYNRPMFFLNQECEGLLQPLRDDLWQAGQFSAAGAPDREKGLGIECASHDIFGYFLPLMVILGEILDLNYTRNRPRFGSRQTRTKNWDETTNEITQYLEEFKQSLHHFEQDARSHSDQRRRDEAVSPSRAAPGESYLVSEVSLQTKTVIAYSTYTMHVLHILLTGKWDPIALLDDNDLWISSESFVNATGHAVSAAQALADIIEYDPDLSSMPFFFGIYLLQGSFLLLLFADKLQGNITSDVVKACETIVRAHEACVATLDTQYQRNFRKVMRSALQQFRGRMHEDPTEEQCWRREILKLYRWTGDGTGLAL